MADDLHPVGFGKISNLILRRRDHAINNQDNDQEKNLRQSELKNNDILRFCEGLPEDMNTHCTSVKELKISAQKQVLKSCYQQIYQQNSYPDFSAQLLQQ